MNSKKLELIEELLDELDGVWEMQDDKPEIEEYHHSIITELRELIGDRVR